jgi:hypothetical protein
VPRYLDSDFLEPPLNRGKGIEVFLGAGDDFDGEPTIRWISVRRENDGFVVRLYEPWTREIRSSSISTHFSPRVRSPTSPSRRNLARRSKLSWNKFASGVAMSADS